MRVYSINSYNMPSTIQAKKSQVTTSATNFSGESAYLIKRAQTALFLSESKKELSKLDKKLIKLKLKAVHKKHPNYAKIQDIQLDYDSQEDLVKALINEYKKINPSGKGYRRDVKKGRLLIKKYDKTQSSQPNEYDAPEGKSIGEVLRSSAGDWPFYTP